MKTLSLLQKNYRQIRASQQGAFHYIMPLAIIVLVGIIGTGIIVYSRAASPVQCTIVGASTEGQKVANVASYALCVWNGGKNTSHNTVSQAYLRKYYADGVSEQWCADFVSYVYATAGYPFKAPPASAHIFTRGGGWDWPGAWSLEHLPGFRYYTISSGYKPKVGDIAEMNYSGGHVQIVVKTNPITFIYGDTGSNSETENSYNVNDVIGYITP